MLIKIGGKTLEQYWYCMTQEGARIVSIVQQEHTSINDSADNFGLVIFLCQSPIPFDVQSFIDSYTLTDKT